MRELLSLPLLLLLMEMCMFDLCKQEKQGEKEESLDRHFRPTKSVHEKDDRSPDALRRRIVLARSNGSV